MTASQAKGDAPLYVLLLRRGPLAKINTTTNVTNRVGVAIPRTERFRIKKASLKKRDIKTTPMQSTRTRTGRSSTLGNPENSEEVDGGEDAAVSVQVSAGEVNANPLRTLNGQLNKESQRVILHKVPLR